MSSLSENSGTLSGSYIVDAIENSGHCIGNSIGKIITNLCYEL